jgi:carbonic anhydrase
VFKLSIKRSSLLVAVGVISLLNFSAVAADPAEEHAHWSYSGDTGPDHWGDLSPEFSACSQGKEQSPVNISHAEHAKLPIIEFDYKPSALDVINNGHTIESDYEPGSSITLDGKTYNLVQFHFHHLSENTHNGKHFPLEGHLVHKSADGKLAVVAVFFEEGHPNPAIATVWASMPKTSVNENKPSGVKVDASQLLPGNREYYTFPGSLTTPPCTEGVTWLLMSHKMTASKEQVAAFAVLDPDDARPVQPLNGRKIQLGGK